MVRSFLSLAFLLKDRIEVHRQRKALPPLHESAPLNQTSRIITACKTSQNENAPE